MKSKSQNIFAEIKDKKNVCKGKNEIKKGEKAKDKLGHYMNTVKQI